MKYMKNQKKNKCILLLVTSLYSLFCFSQKPLQPSLVDFDAYEKLLLEVRAHRKSRLITAAQFKEMSHEKKVIILDTRSDSMYAAVHVKGAIHLNFSDFTQANLAKLIPSGDYKILIYCNNNFDNSVTSPVDFSRNFASKSFNPANFTNPPANARKITLALNIPTYITLYGYGYRNIFELSELVNTSNGQLRFEGTAVKK